MLSGDHARGRDREITGDNGQRLMVLTAEPGTPSRDASRILASWTAGGPEAFSIRS
jgi:hypothetical protein